MAKARSKIAKSLREWHEGKLHSGSKHGPVVTSQKQALAIGFSEERRKKHGKRKKRR